MRSGEEGRWTQGRHSAASTGQRRELRPHSYGGQRPKRAPHHRHRSHSSVSAWECLSIFQDLSVAFGGWDGDSGADDCKSLLFLTAP